jgi:hypothetical protein
MKNYYILLLLSLCLIGCSSLELEAVPSSEQEAQRILALGLSHEDSLIEAKKLSSDHLVKVVSLQITNARDEKIQSELDQVEADQYAIKVMILNDGNKFKSTEISESLNNSVLDTENDSLKYYIEGKKDINSGIIDHKLHLSLFYNSKKQRDYTSAMFCDQWNNCNDIKEVNTLSVIASKCTKNSCEYNEMMDLSLSDLFLKATLEKGFSMRLKSKKKTNQIKIPKTYLMGYLDVAQ